MADLAPKFVLRGHSDAVNAVSFISDGFLASGGADGSCHVWNFETRRPELSFQPHGDKSLLSVGVLSVSERLVTCGRDGAAKVWDINGLSKEKSAWSRGPDAVFDSGFEHFCGAATDSERLDAHTVLLPSSSDSDFVVWDIRQPQTSKSSNGGAPIVIADASRGKPGMLCSLEYLSSQNTAVVGYENGAVHEYDLRTLKCSTVHSSGSESPVMSLCSLHCPRKKRVYMAAGGGGATLSLLQRKTSGVHPTTDAARFNLPEEGTGALALRSDGRLMVAGGWDCAIRVIDTKNLKLLACMRYHRDSVYAAAFALSGRNGHLFVTGCKDGTIAIWDILSDTYRNI
jgi:ASTRA-associated protein 1